MTRNFKIPMFYRSKLISSIKERRKKNDRYKNDITPTHFKVGPLHFKIARHFGFCFGVENAIEIAYRALEENPSKRIFLLSEMIHNYRVNADMQSRGIRFLQKTDGTRLIPFKNLKKEDIVIIPAFGTTVELLDEIEKKGIITKKYNTTCPFVEKVWNRSQQLGKLGYTIIIHGNESHEETRATFSHARLHGPALMIRNIKETKILAKFIQNEYPKKNFNTHFSNRYSSQFSIEESLNKVGIVNQTTMLANETLAVANHLKEAMKIAFPEENIDNHFADTRDTLCYATTENQNATYSLLTEGGDFAIVVGGYNSANTSHLAELLEKNLPTYHIEDEKEILNERQIRHQGLTTKTTTISEDWLPKKQTIEILITAGASCPDALVEKVMQRILDLCKTNVQFPKVFENK